MKRSLAHTLQTAILFLGIAALVFLLWEPHLEGRNANATFFQIYFKDPFLMYVYLASIPFFLALHKLFFVTGEAGRPNAPSLRGKDSLRSIKNSALTLACLVAFGEVFLLSQKSDDRVGGVVLGALIILGSLVVAAIAKKFEHRA